MAPRPDLLACLKEAISFENEDTKCLMGDGRSCDEYGPVDEMPDDDCPDNRCKHNGCMVMKINRWRDAVKKAEGG